MNALHEMEPHFVVHVVMYMKIAVLLQYSLS